MINEELDNPSNPLLPLEPVVVTPVYGADSFKVVAKADDLSSETYLEITDPATGEVLTVPSRFIRAMGHTGNALTTAHKMKTEKQREQYHPLNLFENLAPADSGSQRGKIIVSGANILEIGIPVLTWCDETQVHVVKKNNSGISNPNPPVVNKAGWKLSLTGFLDETLGFANWDDLDGICNLVEYMGNKQGLSTQLALTVPKKGAKLTAGLALQEYARSGVVPEMKTQTVRKKLIDAGYRNGKKGQIAALTVEVDRRQVAIAVGISKEVSWTTETRNREARESLTAVMIQSPNAWRMVDLTGLMADDGKFVHRSNYTMATWFTLIPEEDWARLSPGLSSVAKVATGRSWF